MKHQPTTDTFAFTDEEKASIDREKVRAFDAIAVASSRFFNGRMNEKDAAALVGATNAQVASVMDHIAAIMRGRRHLANEVKS